MHSQTERALLILQLRGVVSLTLGRKGVLDVEDTHHACGNLVMNYRLVVLTNNVNTELLRGTEEHWE